MSNAITEPTTLILEIGKRYLTRSGDTVELTERKATDQSAWLTKPRGFNCFYIGYVLRDGQPDQHQRLAWFENGAYAAHAHGNDIVAVAP